MKRLIPLIMLLLPLALSAQTIYIKGLYNNDKTIKVLYSNNTYDYIVKGNVARVIFFGSNPTALNIEMLNYGGSNDATVRINTNQLIAPANVSTPRALADTLNKWLQTSFGSLGGTVDSIYFRGDTLFYNVIGEGEKSVGIADTVIAGLQTLFTANDSIGITSGNIVKDKTFANTNLTFKADRVHALDTFSVIMRQAGVHSLQLGADVPAGMIPIPDAKVSGFTGSDAANDVMAFKGLLKGISPEVPNCYIPYSFITKGDPFNNNGSIALHSLDIDAQGFATERSSYFDLSAGISVSRANVQGDYICADNNTGNFKWQLGRDGRIVHDGAYANNGYVVYQGGGSDTIPDNVSYYIYDPATVQSGATITLPANPLNGQTLFIFGGGTITSGNVITGFTLDGNGNTVIGNGANNLKVGKAIELHFMNNIWYAIEN